MVLEANIVYLEEELKNQIERLELTQKYLKEHPCVSVYKRNIHGNEYFYKKYWKNGKSISDFLCRSKDAYQIKIKEIRQLNKKRLQAKQQIQIIKQSINALQRQLRIAKKAYRHV